MTDLYVYRASDELAAALREHHAADRAFSERVLAWDDAHPGTGLMWKREGFTIDERPVGFHDGHAEVPEGLSRAKTRSELIPVRTKAGDPWREILARFEDRPKVDPIWSRFEVPGFVIDLGRAGVAITYYRDAGTDGVLVLCAAALERDNTAGKTPRHLSPMKLSEFYAIKERLDEAHAARKATARQET